MASDGWSASSGTSSPGSRQSSAPPGDLLRVPWAFMASSTVTVLRGALWIHRDEPGDQAGQCAVVYQGLAGRIGRGGVGDRMSWCLIARNLQRALVWFQAGGVTQGPGRVRSQQPQAVSTDGI
eukprot:763009-Hanusia_phi.AAC.1